MKILIVDDEPLVRKSLARACLAKGHQVVEAVDGEEGLKAWLANKPDAVFLDVLMPGLSGPELLNRMKTLSAEQKAAGQVPGLGPGTSVILMSAYSGEHNVATAQQMGADLFIPKPFEDIFAVVAKAELLNKNAAGQAAAK